MQVTHVQDHITHAVIGGFQGMDAGVTDDPSLMIVLSSGLYSNPKLAVVREVLCNAWDAHIASGRTDKPVVVTVSEDMLTIRDFGPGISREKIREVYLVYGNSTKRNDGNQTGGFGLGSKAPWAYSDHFEVQSFHESIRTIYTLSKSSGERNGKPGATPIASFPTTESGLQVSIPLQAGDSHLFNTMVQRIACNGEMNVLLNGVRVPGLPLSTAKNGWLITQSFQPNRTAGIYVRYGNVIYPVDRHKEFHRDYDRIQNFLRDESGQTNYSIVFQTPPHSIAVTPSRESLLMQERTIKTLEGLLAGFTKNLAENLHELRCDVIKGLIEQAKAARHIPFLFSNTKVPRVTNQPVPPPPHHFSSLQEIVEWSGQVRYPDVHKFDEDVLMRIDAAIECGLGKQGHLREIQKMIRDYVRTHGRNYRIPPAEWFKRKIIRPLVRDLAADPIMDPKKLSIFFKSPYRNNFIDHTKLFVRYYDELLPIMRNLVVLAYSKTDLDRRILGFPEFSDRRFDAFCFVYMAPRSPTKFEAMRAFFTSRGFTVLDLTVKQPWDKLPPPRKIKDPAAPSKPKRVIPEGYPALSGSVKNGDYRLDYCLEQNAPRLKSPDFFLPFRSSRAETRHFSIGHMSPSLSKKVVGVFGDRCAAVNQENTKQIEKLKQTGAKDFIEHLFPWVVETVQTPNVISYWNTSPLRALCSPNGMNLRFSERQNKLLRLCRIPEVQRVLGVQNSLTKEELLATEIWYSFPDLPHETFSISANARQKIGALPVDQNLKKNLKHLENHPLIFILEYETLRDLIDTSNPSNQVIGKHFANLVELALKG